jgi:hypothetical protein
MDDNQVKPKRRGKRGGAKHKAAAKLAEESVDNIVKDSALTGEKESLPKKIETEAPQPQVQTPLAVENEAKQLPHLSYDTKSYFCTLESKLDDPEALEGLPG